MERPEILRVPGAHNPLAGLLAKRAGFQALYVSGGALTASLALPDLGVMTLEELCFFVRAIFRATGLPLIVDGDTGYGEVINVMRTVRELEAAGAAAVQIEDQMLPKKCGHLSDKRLIPPGDMAAKVQAARRARSHLRIIARTDAAADGLDGAIARGRLYLDAGADIVFPEALASEDDFRAFVRGVDAPLLANMTEFGRTPPLHGAAVPGLRLSHRHLAGVFAQGRRPRRRGSLRPHQGRRRHRRDGRAHADPRTVVRDHRLPRL